ncbi:MAG: hypothetical protein AAGC68_10035 [Verrucomicrobiota bacterium]
MTKDEMELWARLEGFAFDNPEAEFSFSRRLSQESGWSLKFAERVIGEYRKFLFLAATSDQPVTPSDEVDQAWHLHLCYSRSYWENLCRDTLGRPLHHGPTRGGCREANKFREWYGRTLRQYEKAFGERPPREYWPSVEDRFADRNWVRVDRATHVVLPKRSIRLVAATIIVGALTVGCTVKEEEMIALILAFVLIIGVSTAAIAMSKKNGGGKGNGSGCGAAGGQGCGTRDDGPADGSSGGDGGSGCGGGGCGGGCGGGG